MAQIGYGYGSEWQLLRMLGHHRAYFFQDLKKQIGLSPDSEIHWLDYGFDNSMISGDKEYKQREFFESIPKIFTPEVMAEFEKDDFGEILNQNWDGIFWVDKTVYLVEAKAHTEEIKSDCKATSKSAISKIDWCFEETKHSFNILSTNDWKRNYYQMANRIVFLYLLKKHNIEARLVNIYFVDGYEKKVVPPVSDKLYIIQNKNASKEDWEKNIKKEEDYLGISNLNDKWIFSVFVDCKGVNGKKKVK